MDYTIFVKSYKSSSNKDEFVKSHITKQYLEYASKTSSAKNIAKFSSHALDENGNANVYKRDTIMQYFLTQMEIIRLYTDIDVPAELMTEAYDAMSECGAINDLFHYIPDAEIKMLNSMTQMAMDDTYINEQDLSVIINSKAEAIRLTIDTVLSAMEEIARNTDNPVAQIATQIKEQNTPLQ